MTARAKPKPRIRTIQRRPEWPAWARWYAVDRNGTRCLFSARPVISIFPMWDTGSRYEEIGRGPRCPRWRSSLRRIVPAKARP